MPSSPTTGASRRPSVRSAASGWTGRTCTWARSNLPSSMTFGRGATCTEPTRGASVTTRMAGHQAAGVSRRSPLLWTRYARIGGQRHDGGFRGLWRGAWLGQDRRPGRQPAPGRGTWDRRLGYQPPRRVADRHCNRRTTAQDRLDRRQLGLLGDFALGQPGCSTTSAIPGPAWQQLRTKRRRAALRGRHRIFREGEIEYTFADGRVKRVVSSALASRRPT